MKAAFRILLINFIVLSLGVTTASANDFYWRDHLKTAVKYSEEGDAAIERAKEAAQNNDSAKMCRYLADAQDYFEMAYDKVQRAIDTQTTESTIADYQQERSAMGSIKSNLYNNIKNAKDIRGQYCS